MDNAVNELKCALANPDWQLALDLVNEVSVKVDAYDVVWKLEEMVDKGKSKMNEDHARYALLRLEQATETARQQDKTEDVGKLEQVSDIIRKNIRKQAGGIGMDRSIQDIKAALSVTALESGEQVTSVPKPTVTEEAPLLPYEEMTRAPSNFPINEYALKPSGDLRRMAPLVKQLDEATAKIEKMDGDIGQWQADLKTKIDEFKNKEGYEGKKKELTELSNRAADEIQREFDEVAAGYGEAKNILLEYRNKVYTVFDKITKKTVSDKEKLDMTQQAMAKILSPELIKAITDMVNKGASELEKAKTEVNRRFVSFPAQKNIRKLVKEELPKSVGSVVTADAVQSIKDFLSGLWSSIKGLFAPIKENASDLLSLLQTQVEPLLAEETVASKKTSAIKWDPRISDNLKTGTSEYVILGGTLPSEHQHLLAKILEAKVRDDVAEQQAQYMEKGQKFDQYYHLIYTVKTETGETIYVNDDDIDHPVKEIPR